jgi:hypothetical protein
MIVHRINGSLQYLVALTEEEYGAIGACIEQAADTCNEVPDRDDGERHMTAIVNRLHTAWRVGLTL